MAILYVVVKDGAKAQRSRGRDIFVGQQLAERHRFYVLRMMQAVDRATWQLSARWRANE